MPEAFSTEIRELLKTARLETPSDIHIDADNRPRPMGRPELAQLLGVNERTIRRVEKGETSTLKAWLVDRWLRVTGRRMIVHLEEV